MDTTGINNLVQRRQEDWQEVLLYERLRKGPKTGDDTNPEWNETLSQLENYLKKKHNRRRLMTRLLSDAGALEDWPAEDYTNYLDKAARLCNMIIDNTKTDPVSLQPDLLKDLGQRVYEILDKQTSEPKSMERLFRDFLNAGQRKLNPNDPDESYLVTDHHGETTPIPKDLMPESRHWTMDQILADDPSEKRPFESNDCVRLVTDKYEGVGLPEGIEGYVSGVVSNKYLGWKANYCHVIFILACEEDGTMVEDFLEVRDNDLRRCDIENPPSQFFPYEVARNGQMMLERHEESKPYTYDDLVDFLRDQSRKIRQQSDISKEEESPSSKGEGSPSSKSPSSIALKGQWGAFKQRFAKGLRWLRMPSRGGER